MPVREIAAGSRHHGKRQPFIRPRRRQAARPDALSGPVPLAGSGALEHGEGRALGGVRRQPPVRRAGADHQDERHHRVVGPAGHRDVPARQPARLRLLRLHERVVLRGAEAFAGPDGVPATLPTRAGAHARRAAQGALRVRPGAGAGDADPALLRRNPPEPLVPPRQRMAHRAGDQAHLPPAVAGRGAPRRRLPALHEKVPHGPRR